MSNFVYKRLKHVDKHIDELESLRALCFDLDEKNMSSYYKNGILNDNMVAYVCTDDNNIVGAAYVSDSLYSLYIEQLFVHPDYRLNNIGSNIMKLLLNDKKYLEEKYNRLFSISSLEDCTNSDFYKKLGYKESNGLMRTLKKKLY